MKVCVNTKCPRVEVPTIEFYCPECGKELELRDDEKCPKCGRPVAPGDKYCTLCGERLI